MEIIIGILALVVIFISVSFLRRKKIYEEVDRLETWKVSIMNKPVSEELSKVKDLNMTGQTEELFENWRYQWDDILSTELVSIEEYLFDAEDYVDKYRFKKAKEVLSIADDKLRDIEMKIKSIYDELDDLIGSQAKSVEQNEKLEGKYADLKKQLLNQRHQYGSTTPLLEKELEQIEQLFIEFNGAISNGNYLVARELINKIEMELSGFEVKLEHIPGLLIDCQSVIPSQLAEVETGYNEMLVEGYILDHVNLEESLTGLQDKMKQTSKLLMETKVMEAKEGIEIIKSEMDELYDQIEKEVLAKHFVVKELPAVEAILSALSSASEKTRQETYVVQESYQLQEEDIQTQRKIEESMLALNDRYEKLSGHLKDQTIAFTILKEELEDICEQINSLQGIHQQYMDILMALRKDEMAARDQLNALRRMLFEVKRSIEKSNIPGLPKSVYQDLSLANDQLKAVMDKLEEKPLNIVDVNAILQQAVASVEKCHEEALEILDHAYLAESVIQYGNRYRSKHPSVHESLVEAEQLFRNYEYKNALEEAATSLEKVEPGVMKKIEKILEKES
ncbi:septation ring formation regulator EzrA [Sutcliffiella horikoshii]|uniref:septation ring formation regulator EzrA n=1 Tax=Sutcliffiella horikoshii TaxID=79883 RepID=UPI001F2D1627|nr:septation ring formation regulator EzrA [Sutcliffiella horikoshii]MCG1022035.1 septation ring formation regulator EzrA [Sutcliffiella horikoshii]